MAKKNQPANGKAYLTLSLVMAGFVIIYLVFGPKGLKIVFVGLIWTFLVLFFGLFLFILGPDIWRAYFHRKTPLNSQKFQNFLDVQLPRLREFGFFRRQTRLSHERLKNLLIRVIARESGADDVTRYLKEPARIGCLDRRRVYWGDMEGDWFPGNDEYINMLENLSAISDGRFRPASIREEWSKSGDAVTIHFDLAGQPRQLSPKVDGDWLDPDFIGSVNDLIGESGYCFETPNISYGQEFALVFIHKDEWRQLRELGW